MPLRSAGRDLCAGHVEPVPVPVVGGRDPGGRYPGGQFERALRLPQQHRILDSWSRASNYREIRPHAGLRFVVEHAKGCEVERRAGADAGIKTPARRTVERSLKRL